jgi:hypothetical protein
MWFSNLFNFNKSKVYAVYGKKKIACPVLDSHNKSSYRFCGHEQDFIIGIYQTKYIADNIAHKLNIKYHLHNRGCSINYSNDSYFPFYVLEHDVNESFRTFI